MSSCFLDKKTGDFKNTLSQKEKVRPSVYIMAKELHALKIDTKNK